MTNYFPKNSSVGLYMDKSGAGPEVFNLDLGGGELYCNEPFTTLGFELEGNGDEEQRKEFKALVLKLLRQRFREVIVVTHGNGKVVSIDDEFATTVLDFGGEEIMGSVPSERRRLFKRGIKSD